MTPEGVDAAEWQMELPSILGLAWTGCRDSDMEVVSVESDAVSLANSCEEDLAAGHQANASNKACVRTTPEHTGLGGVASLDAVMPHIALDVTLAQAGRALGTFRVQSTYTSWIPCLFPRPLCRIIRLSFSPCGCFAGGISTCVIFRRCWGCWLGSAP